LRLAVPVPAGTDVGQPYFYPLTDGAIQYAQPQTARRNGDLLVIEAAAAGGNVPGAVEGVLELGQGLGFSLKAVPGAVPSGGTLLATDSSAANAGLLATILLSLGAAVLGGIILNIMPCVFPIISLKALSLAKAGETTAHARREALAYAAGVILVCAALGGVLLLLRSGGEAVGWAFQLQDPRVSLILLLLVSIIGFNLAGLFELPVLSFGGRLADSGGTGGAFWTGMLAAFVATPCTGPFMAGALGAALLLPGAAALAIFVGLGLGIALPFLLLGFIPALRKRLPRPGPWMDTARRILSVPMFATAIGLAWIVGRQAGVNAMAVSLGAVALAAVALWWGGERQRRGRRHAWVPALPLLLAALVLVPILPQERSEAAAAGSQAFSADRLAALRKENRPVFLYFTADWCLTCKVNEKAAIERSEVEQAFATKGIVTLVGDWTSGDPAISRFLAERGRAGVPLYLFYPAGGGEPVELPQVLTPSMLTAL
jgi:thiol:disulfide interchange protein